MKTKNGNSIFGNKEILFNRVTSVLNYAIQELQVDPSPPEQSGRKQQNADVRQHLTQRGTHERDAQFSKVTGKLKKYSKLGQCISTFCSLLK